MGTTFGHRPRSEPPSAMRAIIALLAFATVATCSPESSSSTYANAYSYQNLARKGKDSYDMEYVVKGQDYKGKPLDFNARESKYEYNTVGDYHAVLPEGYVCVCYAVGESAALKCDCGPNPPITHAPPSPSPPKCPYGTRRDPYTGECETPAAPRPTPPHTVSTLKPTPPPTVYTPKPTPPPPCPYGTYRSHNGECVPAPTTTYRPPTTPRTVYEPKKPKMVKLVYETYVPEYLANHPELLSINHQHSHDEHHPTLSLARVGTHPV